MEAAHLQLLSAVDRTGSLAGAAGLLGRTPAAVTQQLARAERAARTPLVIRGPRGATLTPAGRILAGHGRTIDQATTAAADDLAALLGRLSRRLRIGAFHAAALHLLPPALTALRHRFPDAELTVADLQSEHGIAEVAAGSLDMAVIAAWDTAPAPATAGRVPVVVHHLLRDPMVVVLPDDHPLLGAGRRIDLGLLRDESWVTILAGHAARAQFDRITAAAGFTPRIRFQTESYDVAQALVGTGIGVALVSRLALTHAAHTTHRELLPPVPERILHAVTAADTSTTPLAGVFLALLRDAARGSSA
ncbi:LysR family transcriptional regulator [Actinoplanes sp. NPDC051494]|uniref:LysR family transcriptional regulator n=1 Tax=Actinoplanes sp. NPDC051494 TaxID=3363907 RepID=UPI00379D2DA6